MQFYIKISLFSLLFATHATSQSVFEIETVDDYKHHRSSAHAFVDFYAPWCPHCQRLKPEFEATAAALAAAGATVDDVRLLSIDCTKPLLKPLCSSNDANGYPTLIWYRKGVEDGDGVRYDGGERTSEAMARYVGRQLTPALVELVDQSDGESAVDAFRRQHDAVLIAFLDEKEKSGELYKEFEKATQKLIGKVPCGVRWVPGKRHVVLFVAAAVDDDDELPRDVVYSQPLTNATHLARWALHQKIPILSKHSIPVHGVEYPLVFFHIDPQRHRASEAAAVVRRAATLVRQHQWPVTFAWLDKTEWDGVRAGLSGRVYPALTIDDITRVNHRYAYDEQRSGEDGSRWQVDDVVAWVRSFVRQELEPTKFSQPLDLTKDNANSKLKTMVLHTMDDVLGSPNRHLLVVFHNNECGTCLQFYPELRSLAERVADDTTLDLDVYQADAWMNDWPAVLKVSGVPDIRLFRRQRRQWHESIEYTDTPRTSDKIYEWLKKLLAVEVVADDDVAAPTPAAPTAAEGPADHVPTPLATRRPPTAAELPAEDTPTPLTSPPTTVELPSHSEL